jgi:DNA-damage-inducible protein D
MFTFVFRNKRFNFKINISMEQNNKIVLFQETKIRRLWHDEQWYFSIVDVIEVLTGSVAPSKYWTKLRKQLTEEGAIEFSTNRRKLKMVGIDGKLYPTDVANSETLLRLIMSIPSPKAEPFKLWLARVGQERIEEIENPELGIERVKELYKSKGYSDAWIDMRIQSIEVRKQLTDEWKGRDVKEGKEYSILTAEIAKATFGLTPTEHKNVKGLERQNLRDHMTTLELIFSQLGEEMTRKLAIEQDAIGFNQNTQAAKQGGRAAGKARVAAEEETGVQVVSADNFLKQIEEAKQRPLNKGDV